MRYWQSQWPFNKAFRWSQTLLLCMVNDCYWPTVILKAAGLVRVYMLYLRKILGYLGSNLLEFWESKTQEQKKRLYILTFVLFSYIFSTVLEKSVEISWSVDKLHLLKKKTNSQLVALLLYNGSKVFPILLSLNKNMRFYKSS